MNRALRWGTVGCYLGVLTLLLVRPMPEGPQLFPQADKVAHFIALGLMATLLLRAMTRAEADRPGKTAWITAILVSVGYAVGMEFVQARVGRDCSFWDMATGTLGIVVLTILWDRVRTLSAFLR